MGLRLEGVGLRVVGVSYWLKNPTFNFWSSSKVDYSESLNFYFLGFWASKVSGLGLRVSGLGPFRAPIFVQGFWGLLGPFGGVLGF